MGVGLKAYLGYQETLAWVDRLVDVAAAHDALVHDVAKLVVLPDFVALEAAQRRTQGTVISVGAQDVCADDRGPFTGEVSAATLAEIGCRYVEVGHAERRARFGEDDALIARKATTAAVHGLVPILCVGEDEPSAAPAAAAACIAQLDPVVAAIRGVRTTAARDLIVAYEPVWAIGASAPAKPDDVSVVCRALRERCRDHGMDAVVIYGGTAGPGLLSQFGDAVGGVFLGRSAHDPTNVVRVLDEIAEDPGGVT